MKTSTSLLSLILLVFAGHAAANPIVFQSDPHGWIAEGDYGTGTNPAEEEGYTSGGGTISMWYPAKGAFRAGRFSGSDLATSAIGNSSVAFGDGTRAEGQGSIALGTYVSATGMRSFAGGGYIQSSAEGSFAYGVFNTASASGSVAFGFSTTAAGLRSVAFGGSSTASGSYSTAMGQNIQSNARNNFAVGRFNIGGGEPTSWVDTDPLFEVGNGTNAANRSNAMTVYKNGETHFSSAVRVPQQGDISMGNFTSVPSGVQFP